MAEIFRLVYELLLWLAVQTGLSYEAINIVAYFFVVPLVFFILLDRILRTWFFSVFFLLATAVFLVVIGDFEQFSRALFADSVRFLQSFGFLGWDYTEASVWICVILPGLVLLVMIALAIRIRRRDLADRKDSSADYLLPR
jgi:hypothetical protein